MIRIVNWLLTRRCNLRCEYCGITRDRPGISEHPQLKKISYFKENEISTDRVIKLLDKFRTHNPKIFHIFYGGEPFLRRDLRDIIKHCNWKDIDYTIISNCTPDIRGHIMKLIYDVGVIKGFTGSVDPNWNSESSDHSVFKSASGLKHLIIMKKYAQDVVAEVTMTNYTVDRTYDLIKRLTTEGITTSLSAIDISKNIYYDFSAIYDPEALIEKNKELDKMFDQIINDKSLLIHMREILPVLQRYIRSDFDCGIENGVHNLTIDSDGHLRTCLRMRGRFAPAVIEVEHILAEDGWLNPRVKNVLRADKQSYCMGCNHTCMMMSRYIDAFPDNENKIKEH